MKSSDLHPVTSLTSLADPFPDEPLEGLGEPGPAHPDPAAAPGSSRRAEALQHPWELEGQRFTAEECSLMSGRRLRRLCDDAFRALDAEFPAWGAVDEYEVLSAELASRAESPEDEPTPSGRAPQRRH